ncbi:TPA: hypothetical protein ACH3X3_000299 [Trebouxia sp. C0006]
MGVTCDPGCADWAKSFGDCICSTKDLTSFILGLASVVFMGVCCLPQIIINFINGSSDGLSLGMIMIWMVGDGCNLAGVFLTKALPTQVYMACLFAILDILLNVQHCWYVYWVVPRRTKREQEQQTATAAAEPHDPASEQQLTQQPPVDPLVKAVTNASSVNTGMHVTPDAASTKDIELISDPTAKIPAAHQLRALSAGLMLVGCGMMTAGVPTMITAGVTGTLPGASDYKSTSGAWAQNHLSVGRVLLDDSGATAASGRTVNIGQGLGWVMTLTYLAARVPQLFKNFRRGTTEGLSLFMFVLLVLGSITYVLSIFIRSTAAEFVVPKLPWLIEALGAIFLDGSIVFQIFYYRHKNRNKPPPQVLASVNPLGTIAL